MRAVLLASSFQLSGSRNDEIRAGEGVLDNAVFVFISYNGRYLKSSWVFLWGDNGCAPVAY